MNTELIEQNAHRLPGAATTAMVALGDQLGLYRVLADGFDLICLLDTLHDLGDPAAALVHARKALAPDGAVLVMEPNAADDYEANLAGDAGFSWFRQVTQTPVNVVIELRP